jgi:hypothetical protein
MQSKDPVYLSVIDDSSRSSHDGPKELLAEPLLLLR